MRPVCWKLLLTKIRKNARPEFATCHPDRKVEAGGLCKNCYSKEWLNKRPRATCHPLRPAMKNGRCSTCNEIERIGIDEYKARLTIRAKRFRDKHAAAGKPYFTLPHMKAAARKSRLKMAFGITPEQYDEMLVSQNNVCAICNQPSPNKNPLSVDHNHTTGKVRGLLCIVCNTFLSRVDADAETLNRAIIYKRKDDECPP